MARVKLLRREGKKSHAQSMAPKVLGPGREVSYMSGMLDMEEVTQISTEVAKANFGPENVVRVESEPTADSQGEEALNLLIVMAPSVVAESIDGEAVLNTLVQIVDRLQQAGDERFPIIEYATEEELADFDSP